MPITPTFDPTTGASGGASSGGGGGSAPGLTVTGRTDGEAYTVSAGARSLSISNPDGATLSTTVEQASNGSAITVTGSTGTTPSWTAPSGSTNGEAVQVRVKATKGGLSTSVAFTERIAGSAGGWTDLVDLDFTDVTTASALADGSSTLSFQSSGQTVDVYWSRFSGGDGTVTPTNSTGLVFDGGTDTSSGNTLSFDLDPLFSSYTVADVRAHQYAVHVVMTGIVYPSSNNSLIMCGLNRGTSTAHNSGIARMIYLEDAGDGVNEETRARKNTSNSAVQSTTAIKTTRVITLILTMGEIVQVMDTSGSTPPTPTPGTALMIGAEAIGLAASDADYQANGLRCFVTSGDTTDLTVTRLLVQRLQ